MAPPIKGYYFRRRGGRHLSVDDPDAQDAVLYFCWQNGRVRRSVCCHTTDLKEARRRIKLFRGAIPVNSRERFLKELILMGKRAERELAALIRRKRPPKPQF